MTARSMPSGRATSARLGLAGADPERLARYWRGRLSEWLAAGLLLAKGYRILARRHRNGAGEIDLIARRGRRVAFVEVKRRATQEEALLSLSAGQQRRIARAAEIWLARHPRHRECDVGLDLILVAPRLLPRHVTDAYHAPWDGWRR
jgi:putative endonuclease